MSAPTCVTITVRYTAGAHLTCTRQGVRASSTTDARRAAVNFGEKYFGPSFGDVEAGAGDTWLVYGDPKHYAWCWATGLIEVGLQPPPPVEEQGGALVFASGPQRALQERVGALARHGKGAAKGRLLVPGVPEGETDDERIEAFIQWVEWCAQRNGRPGTHGVIFSRNKEHL